MERVQIACHSSTYKHVAYQQLNLGWQELKNKVEELCEGMERVQWRLSRDALVDQRCAKLEVTSHDMTFFFSRVRTSCC